MNFGITNAGFVPKRLEDIKRELETQYQDHFGIIRTDPESNFGQLIGVQAEGLSLLWEQVQNIYYGAYPSTAEGQALDNILQLNGLFRLPKSSSSVSVGVALKSGVTANLSENFRVRNSNTDDLYQIDKPVTLSYENQKSMVFILDKVEKDKTYTLAFKEGTAAFTATSTAIKDVFDALTAQLEVVIPSPKVEILTEARTIHIYSEKKSDGSATPFSFLPEQSENVKAYVPLSFTALQKGPLSAAIGAINAVATPLGAVDSVYNFEAAFIGRSIETDDEARQRRLESFMIAGSSTVEAIRSRLLRDVEGITDAIVVEHKPDSNDGIPEHAILCVVKGGHDNDIARIIFESKAAGIETYGKKSIKIQDSQQIDHNIRFSELETEEVHVRIQNLEKDEQFPSDGADQITKYLKRHSQSLAIGEAVYYQKLIAVIYQVSGIINMDLDLSLDNINYQSITQEIKPFKKAIFTIHI